MRRSETGLRPGGGAWDRAPSERRSGTGHVGARAGDERAASVGSRRAVDRLAGCGLRVAGRWERSVAAFTREAAARPAGHRSRTSVRTRADLSSPGGAELERIFERGGGADLGLRSPRATARIVVPARQRAEIGGAVGAGGADHRNDRGGSDEHKPQTDCGNEDEGIHGGGSLSSLVGGATHAAARSLQDYVAPARLDGSAVTAWRRRTSVRLTGGHRRG